MEKKSIEKAIEKAHHIGYNEGYVDGYNKAKKEFVIQAPCAICNGPMYIRSEVDKIKLVDFIKSQGWCHVSCMATKRRSRK